MQGIVLASHGELSKGLLQSSSLFFKDQQQLVNCCLMEGDDVDLFINTLNESINKVNTNEGVIVLCDMLFGSPCNCMAKILGNNQNLNIQVICGMNLAMLLQILSIRENKQVTVEEIIEAGKTGIESLNELLLQQTEKDELD